MPRREKLSLEILAAGPQSATPRNRTAWCADYQHGRYGHPVRSSRGQSSSVLRRASQRLRSRSKMDKCLHTSLVDFPRIARNHRGAGETILYVLGRTDGRVNIGMLCLERSRCPALALSIEAA